MAYKNKKSLDQWALNAESKPIQANQEFKRLSVLIPKQDYQLIISQRLNQLIQAGIFPLDEQAPNISSYIRYLIEKDLHKE